MLYRFRDMDHLIGKYEELKKQEIYFASQNELNDPLEGMLQIVWDGDEISWKGLINNYLLCLEHTFTLYRLAASIEELMDIPVFKTIDSLPTNLYRNRFNEIKKEFFQKAEVSQFIKAFGKENILIQKKELLYFLRYFHRVAIKIIIESHHKNGLVSDEEMQHVSKLNYLEELDPKVINAFVNAKTDKDKELNELFEFSSSMYEQFLLLKKVEVYNNFNDMQKKWLFINLEFPEKYVENLIKLIYPNCFVSCFSEDYSNSSMWGNYANAHKGACLIFETKKIEEKRYLTLYLPYSISSQGISYKYSDIEFSKVTYNSKFHTINFFDSLGRLNGIQLEQWLVDENKNKSKNYYKIYKDMNHWRENYWNLFKKINCNKTKDWKYENEFRLYITDSFFEFNKANERAIKYKFEDLNGVIFGIKSCIEDKIEIVKIIKQKCKKEKREEFNFYQAAYDYRADKIKIMKLDVLSQFKITESEQL